MSEQTQKKNRIGAVKNLVRLCVFLVIFALLFISVSNVFGIAEDSQGSRRSYTTFYKQPQNSIDIVFTGASSIYRGWDTMEAWHSYGITSWQLASPGQPGSMPIYLIREARKTQDPKLFIVDMKSMGRVPNKLEGRIRTVTDNMRFSLNRSEAVEYALDSYGLSGIRNKVKYQFSLYLYHNRWAEVLESDLYDPRESMTQSTRLQRITFTTEPLEGHPSQTQERAKLGNAVKKNLRDLADFIKSEDVPVLFLNMPYEINDEERAILNSVIDFLEENDLDYLDLSQRADELGIVYKTDFYDRKHLNGWGSLKLTDWLSEYLKENYDPTDHRGDASVNAIWDTAYGSYRVQWVDFKAKAGAGERKP